MNDNFRVSVLLIPGNAVDFLINRQQCTSSTYIGQTRARRSNTRYLKEDLISGEVQIPLFDLDGFLADFFDVETAPESLLALLRPWDSFSPTIQKALTASNIEQGTAIAFRVNSATSMAEFGLQELRLWPGGLAPYLSDRGIIAAALPKEGGLRFLIDLDILFEHHILCNTPMESHSCAL